MKYRLRKDIVISKGTIFECIDEEVREYYEDNYSTIIGLTKDSSGEFIYCIDKDDSDLSEYFEEVED
jgi:hypothetical protein